MKRPASCNIDSGAEAATSGVDAITAARTISTVHERRVFWSGHLTPGHAARRQAWLLPEKEEDMEIKASMPPFNNANNLEVPATVLQIDAPCFGPTIFNAVMRIFSVGGLQGHC